MRGVGFGPPRHPPGRLAGTAANRLCPTSTAAAKLALHVCEKYPMMALPSHPEPTPRPRPRARLSRIWRPKSLGFSVVHMCEVREVPAGTAHRAALAQPYRNPAISGCRL